MANEVQIRALSIEDTYPLSPMQAGMLFHAVRGGDPGVDIGQVVATLHEPLDEAQFVRAWQRVVGRHPILRTRFRWVGVEQPVQEVVDRADLPVERRDWRALSDIERRRQFQALMDHDRARGFDLGQAPLIRLALVRAAENEYWILWTNHHALFDGGSRLQLLQEVFAFYEAFLRDEDPELPLARPYRDYIEWLGKLDYSAAKTYWQGALSGFRAPTPLVVSRDRETAKLTGSASGAHEIRLSAATTSALKKLGREAVVTLNLLLQGAWALLLHRYSGESDIVFGVTRAGRRSTVSGADKMIGLFINTLPVRVRIDPEAELVPWLQQLRSQHEALREHEHAPLFEVQGWSEVPGGMPLFESILVFDNQTLDARSRALGGTWSERRFQVFGRTNYPLTVVAFGDQELLLRLEYSRRRFDDAVVARMLGHLQVLLEAMTTRSWTQLKDLPLLAEAERQQAIWGWNKAASFPRGACLHERFERQAQLTPDATALDHEGQRLTYSELNRRANQLGHRLRELGVTPDQLVGLRIDRGVEMVIGIVGILKAGGAYLPLDPAYPTDLVAFMLEDSRVGVVVTQKSLAADLDGITVTSVLLDEPLPGADSNPISVATADSLAYVIYTSGSTGKPKGALITHYNAARLFEATDAWYGFNRDDVWTLFHSYAFDFSVWELWGALLYGGRVVIVPYRVSRSAEEFRELLVRERVTVLNQTPSAFRQLMQAELAEPKADLALRYVIFGGEALELQSLRPWFERYGDTRTLFVNMYGITETTVHVTYRPIHRDDLESGQGSVIGIPIPDMQVYILDPYRHPVPIGVPGEMYVGGAGVARGYLNRAELTAQRFIPDPFHTTPGAMLYRTGDLARRLENGDIEYLGRIDHQVKLRGFRIELGEIETAIVGHPDIREVVVLAREDAPGDKRLVAYLVAENLHAGLADQLRTRLRASLPEYMVPAHFVMLEAMPLTANGKVDRKALPVPDSSAEREATYIAPRTPNEEILAAAFAEVIGLERVGREDNFFELGGHSLMAMRVVSRVRLALGVDLPLRELFSCPTPAGLSARIDVLRSGSGSVILTPPLTASPEAGPAELSFSQQRLWFLDQFEPGSPTYIMAGAFELGGSLDALVLERALGTLVDRHETLRTLFASVEGRPLQVISEVGPWSLPVLDLSGQEYAGARVGDLLREEAARGFDLARGPLFRAQLYRLGADQHVLLLTMHHIVSDGWSLGILMRELGELYRGFSRGESPTLPVLRIQYRDFARWQREWLVGAPLERMLSHWRERLANAPQVLELPADRPRPPVESFRGARYSFTLSQELTRALRGLARREGATLFMTLLSGFTLLLARYSGQQDLLVGTPVANRNRAELEDLVGFFVNTLVLRAEVSRELSTLEFLGRMRDVCMDAFAHQDMPFDRLVEEMRPQRDLSRNPLFQVMFSLQNAPLRPLELPGLMLKPIDVVRSVAHVDLTLDVQETAVGLTGKFEYATDLFDEATIARMTVHLRLLLEGMTASPERRVWALPLLTHAERHQLLVEWNATDADLPAEVLLHKFFEAQSARTPDATAIVSGGRTLSYRELDRRANQLAHTLQKRGVGPEVLVGLCVNRSAEMIVALLGVLKAGGAFVPIDPHYPAERLAFMLEDCGAKTLVTQESLRASLPSLPAICEVIYIDGHAASLAAEPGDPPQSGVNASSLAYAIYTSGSTGQPKAALVTHRGLLNLAVSECRLYGIGAQSRVLQFASLNFDTSLSEIAMALCSGATLYVEARDAILPGPDLERYLEREKITVLSLTPSTLAVLNPTAARSVEQVIVGGEPCPAELALRWKDRCRFFNSYGPTEATITAACVEYRDGLLPPLIGRPLPNVRVYILDQRLEPVPVGVAGELYIGGMGVARGYLNRAELTAHCFVPDLFGNTSEALMYRSGDFGRWRADGQIDFIGRIDDQVKIRGFRVELGEVEAAIARHPQVQTCVVIAYENPAGEHRLVAYFVPCAGETPTVSDLRQHLKQSLPDYMVPAAFVAMAALPLTPNGKVDRKSLPGPQDSDRALGPASHVAPRTDLEIGMATVWERVLGVQRVGITDNFFDLGGNSLSAIKLIFDMEAATGIRIGLGEVFRSPTIAALVASLGHEATKNASIVIPLQARGDGVPIFCICGINIYKEFAQSLGSGQPVFGVYVEEEQAIVNQVFKGNTPEVSIGRLVEAYYKAIARFRPEGPYRLAGLSFGGILAMELASKMRSRGAEVALVILLDAVLPQAIHRNWSKWLSHQAADILQGNAAKTLRSLSTRLRDKFAKLRMRSASQKKYVDEVLVNRRGAIFVQASVKWLGHQSRYDFGVVLFRASDHSISRPYIEYDEDYGWRRYLGERLRIVDVIGGHRSIIELPNVAELGRKAQQYLASEPGE